MERSPLARRRVRKLNYFVALALPVAHETKTVYFKKRYLIVLQGKLKNRLAPQAQRLGFICGGGWWRLAVDGRRRWVR